MITILTLLPIQATSDAPFGTVLDMSAQMTAANAKLGDGVKFTSADDYNTFELVSALQKITLLPVQHVETIVCHGDMLSMVERFKAATTSEGITALQNELEAKKTVMNQLKEAVNSAATAVRRVRVPRRVVRRRRGRGAGAATEGQHAEELEPLSRPGFGRRGLALCINVQCVTSSTRLSLVCT